MKRPPFHFLFLLTALASLKPCAASHCPGNIANLTPRFPHGASIVIPVVINQAGPFDFMLDTGTQVTIIDPSLASELGLKAERMVGLGSVTGHSQAWIAQLNRLETGSHSVEKPYVVIQGLQQIQETDRHIRGILGENFLAHFDLLIDYPHRLICLDDTGTMEENIRGEHVPLVTLISPENELPLTKSLILSVHLSGAGTRQTLLKLDSSSDGPILYTSNSAPWLPAVSQGMLRGAAVGKTQPLFSSLPPQEMRIGTRTFGSITFLTPVNFGKGVPKREEDGLLPTAVFKRLYISFKDRYVILEPR